MPHIVLINNDKDFRKIQQDTIQKEFEIDVICRDTIENTLHLTDLINNLSAIIIATDDFSKKSLLKLSEKMKFQNEQVKIIVPIKNFDKNTLLEDNILYVQDTDNIETILTTIALNLKLELKSQNRFSFVNSYKQISPKELLNIQIAPCDIFIKIHKHTGVKYILRFKAREGIDHIRVNNYISNEIEYFYVKESDSAFFYNDLNMKYTRSMEINCLSSEQRTQNTEKSYKYLVNRLKEEGFSPRNIELVDSVVLSIEKITNRMTGSLRIKGHLEYLLSRPQSDVYIHNQLTAVIASSIINKVPWGSAQQSEKLSFAAMFHDLDIVNNSELVQVRSRTELRENNFTADDIERVNRHALNSSLFMQDFPDLPLGVESIILQHHGSQNGIGFVEKPSPAVLSPISLGFIIAEKFAHNYIFTVNDKLTAKEIISTIENEYNSNSYKEIVSGLKQAFKD